MPSTASTSSLIARLDEMRQRLWRLAAVRGANRLLASAMTLVLVYLLIDYTFNLPVFPRTILYLIALGGIVTAAVRWVIFPLQRRPSLSDLAGRLENHFPQLNDGLRSTIDFLRAETPGSVPMKNRTIEQATTQTQQLDLASAVDLSPIWVASTQAAVALIVLCIVGVIAGPQIRATAWAHVFDPFSHRAWPKRVEIATERTPPTRVPAGQSIELRMKLLRGDRSSMRASLCYQYDNGPIQQELMTRGDGGIYAASLEPRIDPNHSTGTLHAWIKAGDDQLDLSPITIVPRLAVQSVQARVLPPAYVGQAAPADVNLQSGPASMIEGSRVELVLAFNKSLASDATGKPAIILQPVAASDLANPTTQPEVPSIDWHRDEKAVGGSFQATHSLRFHLLATDADGFSNAAVEEYQLIVRPDQSPSVQIEEPRQNEECTATATIALRAIAEDDLGVRSLSLIVDRVQRGGSVSASVNPATMPAQTNHWTMPLVIDAKPGMAVDWSSIAPTGDRKRFRAIYAWKLADLKDAPLQSGDLLEYHLVVTDNYSVNGQTHPPVSSGKLRISIISQEDLTNREITELQAIRTQIAELKSAQGRTLQETDNLRDDLKGRDKVNDADRATAARLSADQASAAARTMQLADRAASVGTRLEENNSPQADLKTLSHDVAGDLSGAAEDPMKRSTQTLSQLPSLPDAKQRDTAMADTHGAQQQASETLQRAMDRLGDVGSLQQAIARINELLKQQRAVNQQTQDAGKNVLGKSADELPDEDRKKLEAAATAQSKLADATAKAIEAMSKAAGQAAKADPAAAEALSKAAQTASQQQVTANQRKASDQARQNQQSPAQSSQQQAELGLQMIANDLQQAASRKLAQLAKQLEDLQQQIANLIRRQAGHNLDNLTVQGPAATQPAATIADLTAEAERDASAAPPDLNRLATTLAPSEEQTSTNTRDISRASEALPDGAVAASQLLRAADHMDRAIIALHDNQFAAAYEPPQVEALAALLAAKKTVDEQKAKVDEQVNSQQKEAVRQRYMKIKDDQQKLNAEVARIDVIRDANTALKRADLIRLGQLPGEQGGLADRISAMDKDLAAVGSIVYVWANQNIATTMNSVKGDLPVADKDAQTLSTQARIVEQLDAMITNLAEKPKVSKFANDNQGGGGGAGGKGGGAAPLPTEAELRLLRDLQKMVNGDTKSLDATGRKDPPRALEIGSRQGELRRLLEQLLEKSSHGQLKLGPEPDNKDQLPEEASDQDVENNELDQSLLNDKPTTDDEEKQTNLVGERMARSRQRLALNDDPGKVTQIVQDKILNDLDSLVDQARKQQAEIRNPPKSDPKNSQQQTTPGQQTADAQQAGKQPGQKKPGNPQDNPAQVSTAIPPGGAQADLSKEIKESLSEWGQVTPRLRAAQIEGASESIIEQYRKLTSDYYRSLATKAAQR